MSRGVVIEVKRGDSFRLTLRRDDVSGNAVDLTGATVAAKLVKPDGTLVQDLSVAVLNQATNRGQITISATKEETATWPIQRLVFDVEHTGADGTYRRSSDDVTVDVRRDRT